MLRRPSAELRDAALACAEEIERTRSLHPSAAVHLEASAHEILMLLHRYEERIADIIRKSEPRHPRGLSHTEHGRRQFRVRNIRTSRGYGFGCDLCLASDARPLLVLEIGGYKGRLGLDVCRACAERIVQVVDAHLDRVRRGERSRA
jgi:hypothetical protein